jgi:hypothetical protein
MRGRGHSTDKSNAEHSNSLARNLQSAGSSLGPRTYTGGPPQHPGQRDPQGEPRPIQFAVADAISEYTLLCESCGYPLTGLPVEGRCPECGEPVADSLPQRRVGSPWQQRTGFAAWWRTGRESLLRPADLFACILIERRSSGRLLYLNITTGASAIAVSILMSSAIRFPFVNPEGMTIRGALMLLGLAMALTTAVSLLIAALVLIEAIGARIWGRRTRSRITAGVATAVCAHASVGWFIAGAGWASGFILLWATQKMGLFNDLPRWLRTALVIIPPVSLIVGLFIFESLVYIGIRRCRFANRVPPMGDA